MLTVLRKGTFVKKETTGSEMNMYSILLIPLAASKESLSEYLFCANGFNCSDWFFQLNVLFQWYILLVKMVEYYQYVYAL